MVICSDLTIKTKRSVVYLLNVKASQNKSTYSLISLCMEINIYKYAFHFVIHLITFSISQTDI